MGLNTLKGLMLNMKNAYPPKIISTAQIDLATLAWAVSKTTVQTPYPTGMWCVFGQCVVSPTPCPNKTLDIWTPANL